MIAANIVEFIDRRAIRLQTDSVRMHDMVSQWSTVKMVEHKTYVVMLISLCGQSSRLKWIL